MKIPGFIGGHSVAQSRAVSNDITRNLYLENTKRGPVLYSTPGIISRYAIGNGPIRALYYKNGRCFAVSGPGLYELFSDFSSILRGNIFNDGLPVCIDSNRFQLCIVSGISTYIYTLATDVLLPIATQLYQVRFADGYFIGLTPNSQMIRISGQYDGITWDPLDFSSAEGDPDNIIAIITDHREIWTLGAESSEVFYDSGAPDFPFERVPGALIEQGCAARDSVLKQDNAIFWLGSASRGDRIFWRAQGYTPLRISNHHIEAQLLAMTTVADCIGYAYTIKGHSFCVWSFPTADKTFVYDCAIQDPEQAWHELASWDKVLAQWHRHKGQVHCFAFGRHLLGDYNAGIVYESSLSIYDDNGQPRRWMRGCSLPANENKYVFPSNPEIILEAGMGIDPLLPGIDPGNPQVMFRYSKDGGYTFGPERTCGAGKIGEYLYRCRLAGNLGQARKPYLEVSGTDVFRVALIDGTIEGEAGTS